MGISHRIRLFYLWHERAVLSNTTASRHQLHDSCNFTPHISTCHLHRTRPLFWLWPTSNFVCCGQTADIGRATDVDSSPVRPCLTVCCLNGYDRPRGRGGENCEYRNRKGIYVEILPFRSRDHFRSCSKYFDHARRCSPALSAKGESWQSIKAARSSKAWLR